MTPDEAVKVLREALDEAAYVEPSAYAALDVLTARIEELRKTAQENKWYAEKHAEQATVLESALREIAASHDIGGEARADPSEHCNLLIRIANAALNQGDNER